MIDCKDILMSFYKDKKSNRPKIDLSYIQSFTEVNITTLNIGLGDAIVLTSLRPSRNKKLNIYSPNRHWNTLCKFNSFLNPVKTANEYVRIEISEFFDIGNGHLYQKYQRAIGLDIDLIPRGYLNPTKQIEKQKNKIGLCFDCGPSGLDLLRVGFSNPRRLEDEAKNEISKFIENSNFEFVQFGNKKIFENYKIKDFTGQSVEDSLNELSSCEYFIGLNSGFMNAAASLGVKSIIVVNVPRINDLYVPMIVDFYNDETRDGQDIEWLFPQNVHLHQHGSNKLVPKVSEENIKKAIDGNVYPFWKNEYLDLIFERL